MIKVFMVVRWPVGGIRTFINYVYSEWSNPALEIHFLTPNLPEVETLKAQLKNINCMFHTTETGTPSFKEFFLTTQKLMSKYRFDLVHAHGFTSAFSVAPRLPFIRTKAIFTSHDVLNKSQFSGMSGHIKKIIFAALLNRFNCIHSVSYAAQENLLAMLPLVSKTKARVILNGVNTERFFSADTFALKNSLGLSQETYLIGFFGRFMSQKGFKYLVDAVGQLELQFPDKYHVACFGSGGFIREEKASLEKRGLIHLFHFHDFVSDTSTYVKGCDLVAMPSLWEACPLVPMEVLAAGIPLVASSCIGLEEVCENTPTIMVSPANSDELSRAILNVNSDTRQTFIEFAPMARDRFNIKNAVGEFSTLYRQLTDK